MQPAKAAPNTTFQAKPPHHYDGNPPFIIILTVILIVVFFIGFCALYFCKCFLYSLIESWYHHYYNGSQPTQNQSQTNNNSGSPPVNPGLDLHIIKSFPSFPFSSVKELREDRYGLECAICLLEFEQEDILLRLLTTCYHVFHQECIDKWLESNKTCPVCRRNLDPTAPENVKETIIEVIDGNRDENIERTTTSNDVSLPRHSNVSEEGVVESLPDKFSRSKTTGHSIVRNKPEEEDRYTLRLPDHVKIKVTRGHNQTESCISFGELMRNREGRFGEVSGQSLVPKSEK